MDEREVRRMHIEALGFNPYEPSELTEAHILRKPTPGSLAWIELLAKYIEAGRVREFCVTEKTLWSVVLTARIGWRWLLPWVRAGIRRSYTEQLQPELTCPVQLKVKFKW